MGGTSHKSKLPGDYETVEVKTVTPNVLGSWRISGTRDGKNRLKHVTLDLWIYWQTVTHKWYLSNTPDPGGDFLFEHSGPDILGRYEPSEDCEGVVNLILFSDYE